MNVGDKYLCKKSLKTWQNKLHIIKKNNYYKILGKDNLRIITISESGGNFSFASISISSLSPFLFFDYFYTKQEERKLKLLKIKNSNDK